MKRKRAGGRCVPRCAVRNRAPAYAADQRASGSPLSRSASGGHGDVDVLAQDVSDAGLAAAEDLHDVVRAGIRPSSIPSLNATWIAVPTFILAAPADRLLDLVDRDC